jgi:hypothetical protein
MNRRIPLLGLLGFILVAPSLAEGIYKWEDPDGQVHYSDMPKEGAVEVEVQPAQTFSLPTTASTAAATSATDNNTDTEENQGYESLAIVSPGQEETIWNTGGKVTVSLNLQPGLKAGHSIRLYMDGQLLADLPPSSSSLQLSDVYRGEHQVQAEVQNEKGQVQIKASPVTFFYQQTSANRRPGSGVGPSLPGPNF